MSNYGKLLQHPLWQRKRLEVMSRDGFQCVACGSADKTLHVHHIRYAGKPWECQMEDMQTLCDECHSVMPKHPAGGVFYEHELNNEWYGHVLHLGFVHCPLCGNDKSNSHSGCVLFECNCWFDSVPDSLMKNYIGYQGQTPAGYESQCFVPTKGGDE